MLMATSNYKVFLLYYLLFIFFFIPSVISLRSITPNISINNNETLVSEAGKFEAGFFNLGNSQNLYFCIWYKSLKHRTILWVANRDTSSLNNSIGIFKVTDLGNPVIIDGLGKTIWFSNASKTVEKPFLLLLDTGNLVVRECSVIGKILWQSFDFPGNSANSTNKKKLAAILCGIGILFLGLSVAGYVIFLRRKKHRKSGRHTTINDEDDIDNYQKETTDLSTFDFQTIANATNQFSLSSKLGEGGYGPVYKGILANGKEIAVKRLLINLGHGPQEFKNEILLIVNLQHRNLVKLLGCCIQNDERLLIYEYMPNRSLDNFIFDQTRTEILDWNKRLHIISEIARGLLYLHQDSGESGLRVIHGDLKTSNILLDNDMNPKISGFGLIRALGGDMSKGIRIVGTLSYIPPEYAVYGCFSVKNDVYSFGVIVLEMISGKKNKDQQTNLDLLRHAWRLWSKDRQLELIDKSLGESVDMVKVLRCIHIGLLCVQKKPVDRPEMSSVVLMLNGERALPNPCQPWFFPH